MIDLGDEYVAMQVFSFHPLCAVRFVDRTPEQEHDLSWGVVLTP